MADRVLGDGAACDCGEKGCELCKSTKKRTAASKKTTTSTTSKEDSK